MASLTPPGNSETYINPDDPNDHSVSVGDWVSGRPGVANSKAVRQALETLKTMDIAVPVWDEVREQGNNAAYRVAAYARIRLLDYRLPGQNRISARFLGYTCEGAVIRLGKSVDSTVLIPTLDLAFNVDRVEAIPGDVLTYTATVTNTGATLTLSGTFTVKNISDVAAMVAYYDDLVDYQPTTGEGWTPLAGAAAALPGYSPVSPAPLTSGITLTATGRPAPGVVYPTSGDGIVGTQIEPGGVAVWDYQATLSISPEQTGLLLDSERVRDVRNTVHFEVTPRPAERGQPFIEHFSIVAPLRTQSGDLTDGRITLALPNNEQIVFDSITTPALTDLTPGASVPIEATYQVPALVDKGADETDEAYLARLGEADGARLSATAEAMATSNNGAVSAPPRTAITTKHVPIVTLLKSGPETVEAGQSVTYELTLTNIGSAVARELALEDRLPNRDLGLINDAPESLEPGAHATAHASHTVPNTQPAGDLTDIASVVWEDANDNVYGPVSDTFTTEVLSPLPEGTLTLAPAFAGPNVTGTQQTLVATLKDMNGMPLPGVTIRFTVSGPNATSGEAVTAADGTAAFTYTGTNNGLDSVQATAVIDGVTFESNTATVHWVTPAHTVTASTIWGRFFTADNSGVFKTPPTQAPVFGLAFPSINFNPPAGTVPGNTSGVGVNTRPFTNVTMDLNGNYAGTIVAQGNGYQAGVGSLFTFSAVFTGEFTVAAEGNAIFDFFSDDGFIFGIGNGAQRVGGANTNPPPSGLTPFEGYPVMGAYNRPTSPVRNSITVYFPAPGTYPFEIDYTECCGGELALTLAVRETGFGVTPMGSLVISPNSTQTRLTGQEQTFTVTAQDASGLPLTDLMVMLRVSGANTQELIATTDASGVATFTYTGYNVGTDMVQAVAWAQGDVAAYSAEVKVNWQRGAPPPPDPQTPLAVPGWIGSPANQSTVTGQVPIRLASGVNLQSGVIDYWPADNPSALTILATNVSGRGGATLATFDTTKLANGSYIIRLQGTDTGGNQVNSGVLVTVQGAYKPGCVRFTLTDLTVPVVGLPITISRTYDSLERNRVGDFGYGWSLAIGNPRLEQDPAHNVTLTMPDGKRVTFYFKPQSAGGVFGFLFYPRYLPEAGVYGSLTSNGCGLLAISGGQYYCFPGGYYAPTEFTYTDPYGRKFVMSADGALKSITDLNDNVLTFSADGITSSAGVSVAFTRDSQGRITQITDPAGNIYQYGYDSSGDLASVSLPGVADPITYSYENHYFTGAVDPRGNPIIVDTYYPDGRLESERDALGNTWRYAYDLTTHTTTVTNPDGGTVISRYDDYGMLLSRTDPLNHTTTYAYDSNHNLISRTDPLGHTTTYTYDANGNQTSLTNPLGKTSYTTYNQYGGPTSKTDFLGNTQTIVYDSRFRPITISDALWTLATFAWDERGNVLTRADGNDKVTSFAYDSYGNLLSQTDPLGHTTTFTYDNLGRQTSATDARGNTTLFEYDALGHVTRVIEPLGKITRYEYDANGNRTAIVDPRGARTTYDYDAANRLVAVHHPDGTSEQYTYDWRGNVLTHTDPAGHVTRYEYDLDSRLIRVTYAYGTPDAATVQYEYDAAGRKVRQIDPLGRITTYTYDNADHLLEIAAPLGHITHYAYDDNGRRISMTDAGNHTTQYAYDVRGRLVRTTFADGTTIQQVYDGNGNLLSRTDQAGKTTYYGYDDANRLTSVTDPLGHVTAYTYDENNNLLTITDANGHVTTFEYDALNRQIRKTWPDGSFETFTYDLNDNLTAHRLADGNTNAFAYDALNRLTRIDYFDGQTVTFTYTPDGLRQTVTDGRGLTRYEYDARERLTAVRSPSSEIHYTYDAAGNRLSLTTIVNGQSSTVRYAYDDADQLVQVTNPQGGVTTFAYNALGLRTQETLPNGVTGRYTYDDLGRLTSIDYSTGDSFHYTLDPAGNRLSVTEADGSSIRWTYDDAYRLVSETRRDSSNAITYQAAYTYDAVGNRLSQTINGVTTHYTYNELDQLLTGGGLTYTYDGRGNLASITDGPDVTYYTWDAADRLIGVTLPDGTHTTNTYDADGRRVAVNGPPSTVHYLWDEASPYGDVVLESDDGSLTRYLLGGTQLLAQEREGIIRYYLRDGQGSTRTLTDSRGNITDSYTYTAFGELLAQSGATPNAYLYTGQQFDAATGLYSLRARYYAPALGRFLSPDAYPYVLANPIELNRYVYAANNPINRSDPTGQQALAEYMLRCGATGNRRSFQQEERPDAVDGKNLLRKRTIVETIIDQLKNISQIELHATEARSTSWSICFAA